MRMEPAGAVLDVQAAFAALPVPFLILDSGFRITCANRKFAEALSATPDGFLGMDVFDLFAEDDDADSPPESRGPRNLRASLERVRSLAVTDTVPFQRFPIRNPSFGGEGAGERFWSVASTPISGPDGQVEFIILHVEDVTEYVQTRRNRGEGARVGPDGSRWDEFEAGIFMQARRLAGEIRSLDATARELVRMESDARERRRRKQVLQMEIGRGIRAPLNALMASLDRLRTPRADPGTGEFQRSLDAAATRTLEVIRLVNRLGDILQLDAVKADADFQAVDLAAVTSSLAAGFHAHAGVFKADFEVDCPRLPFPVRVDREMWEKVLIHLLTNAFKAAPEGRIRLRLQAVEDKAILEVSDTGSGISEAALSRIFDGPLEDGTHLGMALVKRLVQVQGGDIRIVSRVGQGTEVTVRLPFLQGGAEAAEQRTVAHSESGPATGFSPNRRTRILVAEGRPEMQEYARWLMRGLGDVRTVGSGREAFDLCLADPPDIILCESGLPDMHGQVLVQALRAHPATRSLPILLVTAKPAEAAATEACEACADGFLRVPYSAKDLIASIDAHLRLAALRREDEEERLAGMQRRLESEKMDQVGRLAAGVAHDFNNLLTAVNGYAELALGMTRDKDLRDCLAEVQAAGSRAAGVVKLLLAYGRRQLYLPRPIPLNALVLDLQPDLRNLLLGSVSLVVRLHPDLSPIMADRAQLAQVIMTLALNAQEAMPDGGTFTLETADGCGEAGPPEGHDPDGPAAFVRLILKDTGIGIDPEDIGRIFEPYYTSKPYGAIKGKGLGLSSVMGIVCQHGGHIRVRSHPGQGSTFEILFPAVQARRNESVPSAPPRVS